MMYTLPKDRVVPEKASRKVLMKIKGYAADECFLYCGTKATNLYSHKNVLVHAFDRYPIQPLKIYLQDYGFPIDSDEFALSELIQWIWRTDQVVLDTSSHEKTLRGLVEWSGHRITLEEGGSELEHPLLYNPHGYWPPETPPCIPL